MNRAYLMLGVLAVVAVGLVTGLHNLGETRIEVQRQAAAERVLLDLLPTALYDNHPLAHPRPLAAGGLLGNTSATMAYLATLNGHPSAVLLPVTGKGYEGEIRLLVAISPEGRLLGSKVLQQRETAGLGDLIERTRSPWLSAFDNKMLGDPPATWTLRADGGQFDQIAGATVTSRAVTDALQRSLRFFDSQRDTLINERADEPLSDGDQP